MKFSHTAAAAALFIVNALAAPQLPVGPDQSQVYIQSDPTYCGSGCPQGSANVILSSDQKSFTVIMDQFVAAAGPNYPMPYTDRKNCQINIDMHIPQGWQFSLFSATYRGYIDIEKDVNATLATHYYFPGLEGTGNALTTFSGPLKESYEETDLVGLESIVWSECNADAPLNINSEVCVNTTQREGSNGMISTDSVDGSVKFTVGLQWRTC